MSPGCVFTPPALLLHKNQDRDEENDTSTVIVADSGNDDDDDDEDEQDGEGEGELMIPPTIVGPSLGWRGVRSRARVSPALPWRAGAQLSGYVTR